MNAAEPTQRTGIHNVYVQILPKKDEQYLDVVKAELTSRIFLYLAKKIDDGREYSVRLFTTNVEQDNSEPWLLRTVIFKQALVLLMEPHKAEIGEYVHPSVLDVELRDDYIAPQPVPVSDENSVSYTMMRFRIQKIRIGVEKITAYQRVS